MLNTLTQNRGGEEPPEIASLTLQERKQEVVRTAIWDAATDLFDEKGYDETTIDDIAQRAGISRRSFFRYFASKNDLMAYGAVSFSMYLTDAIEACPGDCSLSEVFRYTVLQVARQCAAHPRTRKIMRIASRYPAAREAQHSRTTELRARVETAYALRCGQPSEEDLNPGVVTSLTIFILAVIFNVWFEQGQQDISAVAEQVLGTLGRLVCQSER